MKKTCFNCEHFWNTITDRNKHLHYFCEAHKTLLANSKYYPVPSEELWEKVGIDFYYDDMETGVAECYLFEPSTNEERILPDSWYEKNKEHNDAILLRIAELNK